MKKIIFLRHGQTDWNLQGLIQGHIDIPLNASGKEQAHTLGNNLKAQGIEHIYSSDLQRAAQTAHIVSEYVQCSVTHRDELREINGGIMQGKTKKDLIDHPLYPSWISEDEKHDTIGFEGGETKRQSKERAQSAIQHILATSPYSTIAICSHGIIITHMLRALLNDSSVSVEKLGNAEYIVVYRSPHGWTI